MRGRYDLLFERAQKEIPGVRVVLHKNSRFIRFVHFIIKLLTLGKFDPSSFITTIMKTIYVPDDWWDLLDQARYITLRHELIHLRQFRRWPFKFFNRKYLWRFNAFIFGFCYLFVLPVRWTMRAKFEREAYTQTLLTHYEIIGKFPPVVIGRLVANMGEYFGGATYFFMWSREKAMRWAAETMVAIEKGEIFNDKDRIDLPLP